MLSDYHTMISSYGRMAMSSYHYTSILSYYLMLIFSHSHATIFQYNHIIMSSYFHNFRIVLLCYHCAPVLSYHGLTVSLHHRGIIIVSACSHIHILPYRYYHTAIHYDVIMLPSHLLCVHQRFPQSPHRLLKAAEPLEAVISSRNLTQYKKFNFASKPKFVNQVWPFNTPHPSNPPVLQSSNHPVILVWKGGMRVAIE